LHPLTHLPTSAEAHVSQEKEKRAKLPNAFWASFSFIIHIAMIKVVLIPSFLKLDCHCCVLAVGWGSFQLGYSSNADLEPGRCRRTDGKKWRCSRDAVADQKYCERHMNRGRHRSRKHVEGQPGHAAKVMSAAVAAAAASATQPGVLGASGTGATAAGLTANQHQQPVKNYVAGASDPCSLQYNR
jgi:hypothetical protein